MIDEVLIVPTNTVSQISLLYIVEKKKLIKRLSNYWLHVFSFYTFRHKSERAKTDSFIQKKVIKQVL
jgi:hypothetical protein